MDFRRTKKSRRALSTLAITTGLLLGAAGCGAGGNDDKSKGETTSSTPTKADDSGDNKDTESPSSAPEQVLAEVKGGDLTLKVTSALRDEGGFVTVAGTVTNVGSKSWVAADWRGDERELEKNGGSVAGASLVDATGKKKYLVLRDTEGRCLCTRFTGALVSGASSDWFAQFPAPPESTTKVDFQVGSMPPASIEITEGE
ncbi:hypothetical protein ACKI1I_17830 [Streptomyces turgidiscabies]|uniref:Putative lipoprotein n=1 Tax=Streptomyces turgidiscabies (strain Car8) TaxID=698760 RepID=L7FFB1_STRT8|nr:MULTISPECIES: hypothetical protein [Streptomyces]ELP69992.1 putative lipoprotein [Streptomyces turgidiscabies Car8]MDX3498022.1 hypothetical protein [Streptomyces turgidiscabies]GAQ69931.1 hypothetical protein T45_01662 [Streptomyces turgidiscabies]